MKWIKIKTIFCHVAIIAVCTGVFCHGYMGVSLSVYDGFNVYAQDSWEDVNQDDLVTAFRYYCKSRNLAIEGSVADALTSFTTTTFNNICNTLGINVTSLQADLKKTVEGNLGLRFLMSQQGVLAYNRIFAEFLQNNDLAVGDEVNDLILDSGKTFTDDNGNSCLVFVTEQVTNTYTDRRDLSLDTLIKRGTFLFDSSVYSSIGDHAVSILIGGTDYNFTISTFIQNNSYPQYQMIPNGVKVISPASGQYYGIGELPYYSGGFTVLYNPTANLYFVGTFGDYYGGYGQHQNQHTYSFYTQKIVGNDLDVDNYDVTATTNNTVINNNDYSKNFTIIYNDGDYYEDDDEPGPTTPPGGGGGGGGGGGDDPGQDPDDWNPTTPTIPNPSSPDFPSIDLPDIDIPDLPSLNFSLGDLREKFPFSLPFDIIAVLNVLDGEPKAPHIEATVPIGHWYTWEIDFDFSEFDNYARLFRAFEFIGFCIGLAVFTVHFVKG